MAEGDMAMKVKPVPRVTVCVEVTMKARFGWLEALKMRLAGAEVITAMLKDKIKETNDEDV